jgi:hypothetical protein
MFAVIELPVYHWSVIVINLETEKALPVLTGYKTEAAAKEAQTWLEDALLTGAWTYGEEAHDARETV